MRASVITFLFRGGSGCGGAGAAGAGHFLDELLVTPSITAEIMPVLLQVVCRQSVGAAQPNALRGWRQTNLR